MGLKSLRLFDQSLFDAPQHWSPGYPESVERRGRLTRALGRAIADRRESVGLTQEQVWVAADVKKTSYRNLEQGHVKLVNLDEITLIATVLNTEVSKLVKDAELLVEKGAVPTFGERAAIGLDAAIGYRKPKQTK
jgi:transcriptional regulator with XRE-family HTH domain